MLHFFLASVLTLELLAIVAAAPPSSSTSNTAAIDLGPCDIYAFGNTPCVAAHSTTRALYGSYFGALYQITRGSDNATADILPLFAGSVASAGIRDSFCASTTCLITAIYDQSG